MALTDDLIAFWEFEEASGTRVDAHGSNDLTDNNTVAQGTGKVGNCADFEKSNSEYLSITDNADLSLGADQAFTIAAWVNFESLVADASQGIVVKDTTFLREYYLIWSFTALRLQGAVFNSSGTATTVDANNHGAVSTGAWLFVVFWHDPTADVIGIQVNNGTADTAAHSTGTRDTAAAFSIGALGNGSRYMDGLIDQVGFWKRVLTADEKTELYNGGAGLAYSAMGGGGLSIPIAYHHYKQLMVNA